MSNLFFLFAYVVLATVGGIVTHYHPTGVNWTAVAIVLSAVHFILGIKIVNEQEKGAVIRFGKILKEVQSGPHLVLWPSKLRKVTKNSIQVEFGTIDEDKKRQQRADQSQDSLSWYVMEEPVRINWGDIRTTQGITAEELERYSNDPYARTLTTDPHLFFRIKVSDWPRVIETIGGLDEAIERIKDTCVSALSAIAGKTFLARARGELEQISAQLKTDVERLVGDPDAIARGEVSDSCAQGIDVEEVRIMDIGTPKRTNVATADAAKAIAEADGQAKAAVRAAEGKLEASTSEAKAMIALAEANKQRVEKEGEAKAAALKAVTDASNNPTGHLILRLDTFKEAVAKGKVVIMPMDQSLSSQLFSTKELFEAFQTTPTKPPTT